MWWVFCADTTIHMLALVAELDAPTTGDQEVTASTPADSATFIRQDWSWNIFYGHSLPSAE